MTIDRLPDDALLEIFDFCREGTMCGVGSTWMWGTLVHVCRRWRCIIFASPRRLDLRLVCTHKTPVRKSLDIWPPLPINIRHSYKGEGGEEEDILAAFEQRIHNEPETEFRTALNEVHKIALLRLGDL